MSSTPPPGSPLDSPLPVTPNPYPNVTVERGRSGKRRRGGGAEGNKTASAAVNSRLNTDLLSPGFASIADGHAECQRRYAALQTEHAAGAKSAKAAREALNLEEGEKLETVAKELATIVSLGKVQHIIACVQVILNEFDKAQAQAGEASEKFSAVASALGCDEASVLEQAEALSKQEAAVKKLRKIVNPLDGQTLTEAVKALRIQKEATAEPLTTLEDPIAITDPAADSAALAQACLLIDDVIDDGTTTNRDTFAGRFQSAVGAAQRTAVQTQNVAVKQTDWVTIAAAVTLTAAVIIGAFAGMCLVGIFPTECFMTPFGCSVAMVGAAIFIAGSATSIWMRQDTLREQTPGILV